jgi:twinkle protein
MDQRERAVYSSRSNISQPEKMGGQTVRAKNSDGKGEVRSASAGSTINGIYRVSDIQEELHQIRLQGLDTGVATGWNNLDDLYKVKKGMMTIITGIPQSGKSEFLDALLVNLAELQGWKFAVFSPENYPISLHVIKLAEKHIGKQFMNRLFPTLAMNLMQTETAINFVGNHFTWMYPDYTEKINLDLILAKTSIILEQYGIDGLIIDPWNELEHDRNGKSETDYISECLTKLRRFTREHNIKTWLVAHPQKMIKNKDGKYDVPTPYDISGSAHWRNKADFCICVHRENLTVDEVDVYVQKVKFKHLGKIGKAHFEYDWKSGRFIDSI